MNRIIILIALASLPFVCQAQTVPDSDSEKPQGKLVGEVNIGTGVPLYRLGMDGYSPLMRLGVEARYYFPNSPWDIGLGSHIGGFTRSSEAGTPFYLSSQHYLAADYNYRINPNFSLFAGMEAGVSIAYSLPKLNSGNKYGLSGVTFEDGVQIYSSRKITPYFAPRVGFEAWNRLRGTFSVGIMDKGDSNFNVRLGYVFGGSGK